MSSLAIPRIVKMPLEVQAANVLRDAIISGAVPAGERVTELQISEQMSLSRATVRTALRELEKEGLLTLVPYTGWMVISLSATDVWELYTLRSAVERLAAQLLAKSMDKQRADRLSAVFEKLTEACKGGNAGRIADADFLLHKTIVEQTGHVRLAFQYRLIEQQIRIYIHSSDALIADGGTIIEQHRPIVEAILAGNADKGGRLSEEHNLTEGAKLSEHLRQRQDQEFDVPKPAAAKRKRKRKGR